MPESPLPPEQQALERAGLEFLRDGKFRKARDIFKSLQKFAPSRALPLLIEANLGLANAMMSKGQVSEANQVLAYLKTIAPPSYNLALGPVGGKKALDAWSAMVPLAEQRLATSTQAAGSIRAADEIILGATSPEHPGHPDAKAILSALELGYGAAAAGQTTPLLRSVPRSSPFSHWVYFFKGMAAFEAGDHARAADCFRRVPETSLLQASIPALLAICDPTAAPPPPPRTVHALCAWIGQPAIADPLLQADPLWRKKQRAKAFTLLSRKIPDLFSVGARSFKADLTRFLTSEFVHGHSYDREYVNVMFDCFSAKSRPVARTAMHQAFFAIDFASYPDCAHRHFRSALARLDELSRVTPISPAMLSRIFMNLAEIYISEIKKNPRDGCSPPNAKRALEHALKHDPENLRAWLMQCDLLAMGKNTSAYHRFVDDLTKRFPGHKEVLIRNGDCCLGRQAFTKALRNFERAASIDAVDPRIAGGILRAHLGIAGEAYKKRKPAKVDWDFIESLATASGARADFPLWRLRVRRIVLETGRVGTTESELLALAASALPLAPNAFLLKSACCIEIAKSGFSFNAEVLGKMFPTNPAPESLADFLAVIEETDHFEGEQQQADVCGIARQIFAQHASKLLRFVAERKDLVTLLIRTFSSDSPKIMLVSPVIQEWYLRDPDELLVRWICSTFRFPWLSVPPDDNPADLAAELRDSHDPDILRLLRLVENDRQRSIAEQRGGSRSTAAAKLDLDYDPHEEDEFDDDDPLEDDFADLDQTPGELSPARIMAALGQIFGPGGYPGQGNPIDPIPYSPPPPKPAPMPRQPKRPEPDPRQLSFDADIFQPAKPPQP